MRTFRITLRVDTLKVVGTIATLISSVANITAIFVLEGLEPAFVSPVSTSLTFRYAYLVALPTSPFPQ
jgi:hypothetical protein